jgi:hypothetical protein
MPTTRGKEHGGSNVGFDELVAITFSPITLAASVTNAAIQAFYWLPTAMKFYRLVAGLSGTVAGTCAVNVVAGTAAELTGTASQPTPDTDYAGQPTPPVTQAYPPPYATAGQRLLAGDQAMTMTTGVATVFTPSGTAASGSYPANTPGVAWDGIWGPGGSLITVRVTTGASTTGTLLVTLLGKFYDTLYNKPVLTSFNPATDIP